LRWGAWQRQVALALAAAALLVAGLYAVPETRGAIDDLAGTVAEVFGGYQEGGDEAAAPGRPLQADEPAPAYFTDQTPSGDFAKEPRVLAEASGYKLYAYLAPSGSISFDLGDTGVGMGFESADEIGPGPIYFLGSGSMRYADDQGHLPLFGLAASTVSSVELVYERGPPAREDGIEDGFVLLAEPGREPREIVGYDQAGEVMGRKLLGDPGSWLSYARPDREG
jgi:hypothetical protein